MDNKASQILKKSIESIYGALCSGCVFLVCRNGAPYADGSFGWARRPESPDGGLLMGINTQVHVGSISKFICAVGILRLIEESEWIFARTVVGLNGVRRFVGPLVAEDARLVSSVIRLGGPLTLDTKVYTILEPHLNQALISGYVGTYPGDKVADITIRQLLQHQSGLPFAIDVSDLGGALLSSVFQEPSDGSAAFADIFKEVTALFRPNANFGAGYSNTGYTVLGALVEAMTGRLSGAWFRDRLFQYGLLSSIDRKVTDPSKAARYYRRELNDYLVGNYHPNYSNFSAAGGWYVSASAFCGWVDFVMNDTFILRNPNLLLEQSLGLDGEYRLNRLHGASKNGAASPGGGHTNARFVYLKGYGNERLCAFVMTNTNISANSILDDGLRALRHVLTGRPGAIPTISQAMPALGLRQSVYWEENKQSKSAGAYVQLVVRGITVDGELQSRTDILGIGSLSGGKTRNQLVYVESRGMLHFSELGSYRFRLSSDDGALVWLDQRLIVDNDGNHGLSAVEGELVQIDEVGYYPIVIRWHNSGGNGQVYIEWMLPSATQYQFVDPNLFVPH